MQTRANVDINIVWLQTPFTGSFFISYRRSISIKCYLVLEKEKMVSKKGKKKQKEKKKRKKEYKNKKENKKEKSVKKKKKKNTKY